AGCRSAVSAVAVCSVSCEEVHQSGGLYVFPYHVVMAVGDVDIPGGIIGKLVRVVQDNAVGRRSVTQRLERWCVMTRHQVDVPTNCVTLHDEAPNVGDGDSASAGSAYSHRIIEFRAGRRSARATYT